MSDKQTKSIYLPLSNGLISYQKLEEEYPEDPLANVHKIETTIQMGEAFQDDVFRLSKQGLPKGVVVKRLRDIFQIGSSIKQSKYIKQNYRSEPPKHTQTTSTPSYISQLKMFPEWHFLYLIQPAVINEKGYYHVAVVKEGRIIKKIVDDYVYYDEQTKRVYSHPFLEDKPWIHIIIKTWAKMNKGYQNIANPLPFLFVKAFTFPDWAVFNPSLQNLQNTIKRFSSNSKKDYIFIAKTKDSSNVGLYGLIPNCASYLITGYYQEYEHIFISIKSYVGDKWNKKSCDKQIKLTSHKEHLANLGEGQFMLPLKDFINLFHLVYFTNNKFSLKSPVHYNKLTLNLDARESKAKLILLQVQGNDKTIAQNVNLNLYFPTVKTYDLANKRNDYKKQTAIPFCKILIGREMENPNNLQSSYADSVKQKLLKNEGNHFLALSNHKYEYIRGDYFMGYSSDISYHLKLKPGNYILRLKIQKLLPQYRTLVNVTSSCPVKLSQNKSFSIEDQSFFLAQTLSSKARSQEEKNTIFPNQKMKHTWLKLNNDFNQLGYGSILFQIGKNDNRRLNIEINSQKIKQSGYRLKNKTALIDSKYRITLKQKQSKILILKQDIEWKGTQRKWPPEGIHLKFDNLNQKLQSVQKI